MTSDSRSESIALIIAAEIGAQPRQVLSAVALLDEGASVPFVARYRKEVTGGLDDTQLRNLETCLGYHFLIPGTSRRSAIFDLHELSPETPKLQPLH